MEAVALYHFRDTQTGQTIKRGQKIDRPTARILELIAAGCVTPDVLTELDQLEAGTGGDSPVKPSAQLFSI